jgi:hypothetical protein
MVFYMLTPQFTVTSNIVNAWTHAIVEVRAPAFKRFNSSNCEVRVGGFLGGYCKSLVHRS